MRTLSLYLSGIFLRRFLMLLFGLTFFLLSLDLAVNSGEVLDKSGGELSSVLRYSWLRLPEIVSQLVQIATLLAGLITLAQLVRNSELVAIWNIGVSPWRTLVAFMPIALLAGLLQFAIDDQLVPNALNRLNAWGVAGYGQAQNLSATGDVAWLRIGHDIVRIPGGDMVTQPYQDVAVFQRGADGQLLSRLDARQATLQDGLWILTDVTRYEVGEPFGTSIARIEWQSDLKSENLAAMSIPPREMTTLQLYDFASDQGLGFWPPHLYQTWFQKRLSVLAAPLLLIFLIIPLAQRFQRTGGTTLMFVIGVGVGFAYFILDRASLALGEVGLLPAFLASWAPSLALASLAAGLAFHYELRVRSATEAPAPPAP